MRCCQEMFKKWLETENASWDQLLEALRSPSVQLVYLASQSNRADRISCSVSW